MVRKATPTTKNRCNQVWMGGVKDQFVELNPQNAGRENSFVQQIGDELQLDGGLAHLARSADRHDGRYVSIETPSYAGRQVAAGGRNPCGGLVRPPRIETVKVGN